MRRYDSDYLHMADRTLYRNAYVATMDGAGAEHVNGWILVVGGEDAVTHGRPARADEQQIAREHRVQARRLAE